MKLLCSGECWKQGAHLEEGKHLAGSGAWLRDSNKVPALSSLPVSLGEGVMGVCRGSEATENQRAVNMEPSGQCCGAAHRHSLCHPTACEGILTVQQHLQRKPRAIQTAGGSITNTEQKNYSG